MISLRWLFQVLEIAGLLLVVGHNEVIEADPLVRSFQ